MDTPAALRASGRPRVVASAAFAAVALYVLATFVGAAAVPGYSHLSDSISELTSSTGAHRGAIAWGYVAYNIAVGVMAWALWATVRRTRASAVGAILLGLIAAAGIAIVTVLRQDPRGEPLTGPGLGHIVLAGLSAAGLIAAAFVWSRAFATDPRWVALSRASFWAAWAILVLGGAGAVLGAMVPSLFGLGERFTMVVYLTWFAMIGVTALRVARREGADSRVA